MAILHSQAVDLQQAIQNSFARSGEAYVTAQLRSATPIHDEQFVVVSIRLGDVSWSITFEEMVSLDTVRSVVRLARQSWTQGKTQGRDEALARISTHLKDVAMGHYEAKDEGGHNG